jgi:hypothetical protein
VLPSGHGTLLHCAWHLGDTGPLAWPVMTMGCVKACPFPSGVRSLTPCSSFCICDDRRQCGPPTGPMPQSKSNHAPLGSGGAELPFLGLGEARPIPLGSGELQPAPKGSNEWNLCPRGRVNWNLSLGGRMKPWLCPLTVCLILIIGDHEFPFFRYPKIGTRHYCCRKTQPKVATFPMNLLKR